MILRGFPDIVPDDGQWHADQETIWDFNQNTFRTVGFTSADAAGLPILPGLARPDEALPLSAGGQGVFGLLYPEQLFQKPIDVRPD